MNLKEINTRFENKILLDAALNNDTLTLKFHGETLSIEDVGQQCCESRYMHTDDDLADIIGGNFLSIEVSNSGPKDLPGSISYREYNTVEETFLRIVTSRGEITIANYNIHNGYYDGFDIRYTIKET